MQFSYRAITFATLIFASMVSSAMESDPGDPLFRNHELLEVTITAPLNTLVRERPKEDYLPGVLQYTDTDGAIAKFDIEIRTRGHFRHDNCDFPPLRLNFKKSETDGTLFDHQDKMKLGVHCGGSSRYEQIVFREYLAYRMFNAITDMSFRVRLLRVTYVDTDERRKDQTRYAFLIEHKDRLAARYDMKDLKIPRTTVASIKSDYLNLTSMFELFIGNTDFSPIAGAPGNECCHNYVLFGKNADPLIAIPYDFDQSGFVDAPYATPNENFPIRSVRQRLYRGRCVNNEHIPASMRAFRDQRAVLYGLVNEQEGLTSGSRKKLIRYIDKFFELIDDPNDVDKKIIDRCV